MSVFHNGMSKLHLRLILIAFLCCLIVLITYITLTLLTIKDYDKRRDVSNTTSNYKAQNLDALPSDYRNGMDAQRLFLIRIAKTGSTTLTNLIKQMGLRLGYEYSRLTPPANIEKVFLRKEHKQTLVHYITHAEAPRSFEMILPFVDFNEFGEKNPTYISSVRDPVERYISSYYYWLQNYITDRLTENNRSSSTNPDTLLKDWSMEDCIMNKEKRCALTKGENYTTIAIGYFCGHDPECWILGNPWALQTAKRNIERAYGVVGVVEFYDETVKVLEHYLPQFFKGAYEVFKKNELHLNKNQWKADLSAEARQIVKDGLAEDYELYDFVVKRLHDQYKNIEKKENFRK